MKNFFFPVVILIIGFLIFSFSQQQVTSEKEGKNNEGIFIHVSHGVNQPHRVLMALSLAEKMAGDKDVILYFDINGIGVLLKDAPDLKFSHFTGSHTQIQKLLDMGITIMACPGCLKAAGKTPEDLREGITIADKEKFFNFTSGRILTMNY
jgi:predicted peroxiredoxin